MAVDTPEEPTTKKTNAAPKPKAQVKPKVTVAATKPVQASTAQPSTAKTNAVKANAKKKTGKAKEKEVVTFSTNVLHNAAWLVYLNGIEVQASAVSVQFGVWQIPTAQVVLPPHIILQRLGFEDRIMVTIFYLDEFYTPNTPKYCLMGEFELIEWSYVNTGSGRSIQLSCRSPLQIFEQLKFYYMSSLDDIVTANGNVNAGAADTATTTQVLYPQSLFHNGLIPVRSDRSEEPAALDFVRTPSDFIWNLFKGLTGKIAYTKTDDEALTEEEKATVLEEGGKLPQTACAIPGRNFFGRWIFKNQFQRRWVGLYGIDDKDGDSVFPLLSAQNNTEILQALQQQIGVSVGSAGTAWELLQKVMGVMLMEINTTPAPPIGQVDMATRQFAGQFNKKGSDVSLNYGSIYSHYVKPQCIFAIPPACNIIFPSMITSYSFAENYLSQPTRVYLGEDFLNKILQGTNDGNIKTTTAQLLTTGYPPIVKYWMRQYITAPDQNTKNFLIYPEEFFKGPIVKHMSVPTWTHMLSLYYKGVAKKAETEGDQDAAAGTVPTAPLVQPTLSDSELKTTATPMGRAYNLMKGYSRFVSYYRAKMKIPVEAEPLIFTILWTESGKGQVGITSATGAVGLAQHMPKYIEDRKKKLVKAGIFTSEAIEARVPGRGNSPEDAVNGTGAYNPEMNIAMMMVVFKELHTLFKMTPADYDINLLDQNLNVGDAPNKLQCFLKGYGDGANKKNPWNAFGMWNAVESGTFDFYDPNWTIKGSPNAFKKTGDVTSGLKGGHVLGGEMQWQTRSRIMRPTWDFLRSLANKGDSLVVSASSPTISPSQKDKLQTLTPEKASEEAYAQMQADLDLDPHGTTETLLAVDAFTPNAPGETYYGSGPDLMTGYSGVKPTTAAVDAESDTANSQSDSLLGGIYDIYAKYEYFKSRYAPRSANVSLAFDPYLVPGFPAVIFDSRVSRLDTIGYVMSVTHSWDAEAPSISTQATLSYTRSFPEFIGLAKNGDGDLDIDGYLGMYDDESYSSFPREPIDEVADLFQTENAASVYLNLLYPKNSALNKDMMFIWNQMLDVYSADGKAVTDFKSWRWHEGMFVDPKDKYAKLFTSYDSAMHYVSRPATTLDEYIQLRSGKTVAQLRAEEEAAHRERGTKIDASTEEDMQYMETFHLGAVKVTELGAEYYSRIYGLLQGPRELDNVTYGELTGINPIAVRDGYKSAIMDIAAWTNHDVDAGLADTRQNWDKIIQKYRQIIRSQKLQK